MTEEKKLIVGLQNMRKRLISAAQYLQKQGDKAGMDRCGRDCRLIEKAVNAIEGPKTRLMPVEEVLENPETLIWLEHYRYIDNGPVITPTAMYPANDDDSADGYVHGTDEGVAQGNADGKPRVMDFYCGDIYQTSDYGRTFRCWIGDKPSEVFARSVPWSE